VTQCLQRVARSGVTVAAVLHQPSFEAFEMFDDVIFPSRGGLTAYAGTQQGVQVREGQW
jgi:ABC-type multidrug transport system ATPase subunit